MLLPPILITSLVLVNMLPPSRHAPSAASWEMNNGSPFNMNSIFHQANYLIVMNLSLSVNFRCAGKLKFMQLSTFARLSSEIVTFQWMSVHFVWVDGRSMKIVGTLPRQSSSLSGWYNWNWKRDWSLPHKICGEKFQSEIKIPAVKTRVVNHALFGCAKFDFQSQLYISFKLAFTYCFGYYLSNSRRRKTVDYNFPSKKPFSSVTPPSSPINPHKIINFRLW